MKKNYILILVLFLSWTSFSQILEEGFESYTLGSMGAQNPNLWRTWSGDVNSGEDITIVNDQVNSGIQSGYIGPGQNPQDAVLTLGNLTSGTYTLDFKMYIPSGKAGYFNIQGTIPAGVMSGVFNSGDIYFNETGVLNGLGNDTLSNTTFSYPENQWFNVRVYFDLDAATPTYQLIIDGIEVTATPTEFQATGDTTLGGIDFFAAIDSNEYWIDDIAFNNGLLSTAEFNKPSIKIGPNPVEDRLSISSNTIVSLVEVYNVLGKLIISKAPNELSFDIDFSNRSSGMYFVKIQSGNVSQSFKVLK